MAAFKAAFSWMKDVAFSFKSNWTLFPGDDQDYLHVYMRPLASTN